MQHGGVLLVELPGKNADFGAEGGVEAYPSGLFHSLTSRTAGADFLSVLAANDYAQLGKRLRLVL